ncbi:hypothetical protein E4U30_001971 [Claviceps sp. LM220 group G6]|nr:hypothetical protein E4U15_006155 [Claviceps sp. LM218 group G6]KAG6095895.1 hypothetical protein E4U30_001971 [Claviceps sp. LM220 group G6]
MFNLSPCDRSTNQDAQDTDSSKLPGEVMAMVKGSRDMGVIGGEGVEMVNQICHSGVAYQARILESDLYNDAIHFLKCCN